MSVAVGLAGATAAAVLAVTTVSSPDGPVLISPDSGASASQVPGVRPTARQILLAAATAVAKAPAEGAYWHTREVNGHLIVDPGRHYVIQRSSSRDTWLAQQPGGQSWWIDQYLGAKPATPRDEAAWREAGSPGSWQYSQDVKGLGWVNPEEKVKGSPNEPVADRLRGRWKGSGGLLTKKPVSWAELRAIPSGPQELRTYLEARITQQSKKYPETDLEQEMEKRLQGSCMEILFGLPVSPKVRASAYQILASLPGMEAEGEVTDPLGRIGQALSYEYEADTSPGEVNHVRFVIDLKNGLFLASQNMSSAKLADGRSVEIGSFTAYEGIGWTDETPELPAQHD